MPSGGTTAPASGTTETWTVASSSSFPAASSSATPPTQFHVADITANSEIVAVTNVSGTTWTVTRGAEGTTPVAHTAGFTVFQVTTAGWLNNAVVPAAQAFASSVATAPFYSAHRSGGSPQGGGYYQGPYPEETIQGYRATVAAGAYCLNTHVRMLADGALVLMHDSTPDRTTNATGSVPVADYMTTSWRQINVTPQNTTLWPSYGVNWGTIYPPFWEEFLDEFGGKVLIVAEAISGAWQATGTVGAALTRSVLEHGLADCVIISSFAAGELTVPAAAGIQTMYFPPAYGVSGYLPADIATAMASGWGAGLPHNVGINAFASTKANIQAYVPTLTAGPYDYTVWGWTLCRRSDVAWLQAAGVTGFFTDEPIYNAATGPVNPSGKDPTSIPSPAPAVWPHGTLPADLNEGRGNINNGGVQLDYTVTNSSQQWVCYGSLCPIANAASTYTISDTITYSTLDTDTSRWAGLYICCPDDSVTSGIIGTGTGLVNGYTIILRITGQLAVFRNNGGATQTQSQVGSSQSTQAISAGQSAVLSVQVTSSQIIITPTVNGTGYGPFTFSDSTYRGGYFHIGKAWGSSTKLIATHKSVTAA